MNEPIWGDVLQAFQNGVQLDLRLRMAIDFLKAWPSATPEAALAAAERLLWLGSERGYVKPLPEDSNLTAPLRHHLERSVRAQAFSQVAGQRIAQEEQPKISSPPLSMVPPRKP